MNTPNIFPFSRDGYHYDVQPRTRTAADAQQGDRIWYVNGSTGKVEHDRVNSVSGDIIYMIPNAVFIEDFGTKWGYAEEETK